MAKNADNKDTKTTLKDLQEKEGAVQNNTPKDKLATKAEMVLSAKKPSSLNVDKSTTDKTITLMSTPGHSRLKLKSVEGQTGGETLAAYKPQARSQKPTDMDEDSDPIASLSAPSQQFDLERPATFQALNFFGAIITLGWLGICYLYIQNNFGWEAFTNLKPHEFGGFLAGVIAPVAVFWMILAYIMRGADVKLYAEALRGELHTLIFPTEKRAARVHEDIEKLIQQSTEMAVASKAVLKSIHRARQGLRAEMREFATLAKKGEHHLVRLSENIEGRSKELLELTTEIEKRTENIDKVTQNGANAWDEATKGVLERATEIETTLEKGADRIIDASENARNQTESIKSSLDETYENLGQKVDDISDKMDGLSSQFDVHAERLSGATDKVSDTTDALSSLLDQQLDDLDSLTTRTLTAIAEASENTEHKQKALVDSTEHLIERAEQAADTVEEQIGGIYKASNHVSDTFKGFEISVQEQADKLTHSVDGLSDFLSKIEDTGDDALLKLNEAVSSALSTTENMAVSVRRSAETIKKATQEAEKRNENLVQVSEEEITKLEEHETAFISRLEKFSSGISENIKEIEEARDSTEAITSRFDETLKSQYKTISEASDELEGALGRIETTIEAPLKSLNSVMGELDKRQTYLEETFTKRAEALNEASEKALETTHEIRDALKGQVQDIATMTGQISGHAQSITSDFQGQRDALEKTVRVISQDLEDASKLLEEKETLITRSTENSTSNIIDLGDALAAKYETFNEYQKDAELALNAHVNLLATKTEELDGLAKSARDDIGSIQASVEDSFNVVEPIYTNVLEQAENAKEELNNLKSRIETQFTTTLETLQETGTSFEKQTGDFHDGATEALDLLRAVNQTLESNTTLVIKAADDTKDKTQDLIKDFENKAEDIHLTADQASLKIDSLQKSLSEQVNVLSDYVGQSISLLGTAERNFDGASSKVKISLEEVMESYETATEKAEVESKALKTTAEDTVTHIETAVSTLKDQTKSLLSSAEESLSLLKQNGDHFAVRAMELEAQMKASSSTSKEFGRDLREQAADLGRAGHKAADMVSDAISKLSDECAGVSGVAEGVKKDTEKAGEAIAIHAKALEDVSDKALTIADEAARNFAKHSNALAKSAQDALEHVQSIQAAEAKVQKDAFFTSAKFIVESLHSLSVDITRQMQNGEISEKLWKLYQKGDLGVFTKRLAEIPKSFDEQKTKEKFSKDTEFRSYVQRYIRQYEELYEQAQDNDHGSLLTATFLASDVGKLYQSLCEISGRTPRSER